MIMPKLGLFFVFIVYCNANTDWDQKESIFTENGRPMNDRLEEEISDQLWRDQEPNPELWQLGQPVEESEIKQERPVMRKRQGQAEFATFIDPTNQQILNSNGFEKRARMDQLNTMKDGDFGDTLFIAVTTVCTAAAVFGLVAAAFVWHRVHKRHKAAQESEYPHYGITGPSKERTSGGSGSPVAAMDAKLASSAQLYHYQHTKQQIIAMEQSGIESKGQESDSECDEDEGDFSVYEYPGLAPTGDIEVTNPLFENVQSPQTKTDPKVHQLSSRLHLRGSSEDQSN